MQEHREGLQILNRVIKDQSWDIFDEYDIYDSDFEGEAKSALEFLRNYTTEHESFPPKEYLEEHIRIITEDPYFILGEPAAAKFVAEKFEHSRLFFQLSSFFDATYLTRFKNGDLEGCRSKLYEEMAKLTTDRKSIVSYKENSVIRTDRYKERQAHGLKGIRPCYPTLEERIACYANGTLNVMGAKTSRGKSWTSAYQSLFTAFEDNKRVLHVTMENTASEIEDRMDVLTHSLNFDSLKHCSLDSRVADRWRGKAKDFMDNMIGDVFIADKNIVSTVGDIHNLAIRYEPNLIVIDGAYLLNLSGQGTAYEKSEAVINGLFFLASELDLPILGTIQLKEESNKKAASDKGYASSGNTNWIKRPHIYCVLDANEDDFKLDQARIQVVKGRELGEWTNKFFTIHAKRGDNPTYAEKFEHEEDQEILDLII